MTNSLEDKGMVAMPSNSPYTFDDLFARVAEGRENVPIRIRSNTDAQLDQDLNAFRIFLYGSEIAVVFSDGKVKINRRGHTSPTTRNRINDVLLPLGWRIVIRKYVWYVQMVASPHRLMEYVDDMILTSLTNNNNLKG